MKMIKGIFATIFLLILFGGIAASFGSNDSGKSSGTGSSPTIEQGNPGTAESLPSVKTLWAEFDVKVDSLDESGIDFTFTNKQSRYEILVTVNYVTAGGITYSINDGVIHIAVDGESNDMGTVTIPAGSSVRVRFSVDGVSDYRNMKIEFNENDYNDSGENLFYEGASITVGE